MLRSRQTIKPGLARKLLLAIGGLIASGTANAQSQQNQTFIGGGQTDGVTTLNAASGNNNQQANVGLLSAGGTAWSNGSIRQVQGNATSANSGDDRIAIGADAFVNSTGWLAVNGVAGNDNQQANVAAIAIGIEASAAADSLLSQSRASTEPTGGAAAPTTTSERAAAIGDGAFEGSRGLVQVSLIGGDRNSSANSFAVSMSGPAGTSPTPTP